MGGCKAPIPHPQHYPITTTPILAPAAASTTRRFFFLSIPFLCANNISISSTASSSSSSKPGIQVGGPLRAIAESVSERDRYDPLTKFEKESSLAMSKRISEAVELLEKGRELQAKGDFNNALVYFTMVVENYKDFALSEYARVGRALALYEVGNREEAIAEMEDVSISLKGYPEVHAALAAALYVDKHAPLLAENQFTIAMLLDPHYTDLSYVKETKHWPPSLVSSLEHFITLS